MMVSLRDSRKLNTVRHPEMDWLSSSSSMSNSTSCGWQRSGKVRQDPDSAAKEPTPISTVLEDVE